MRRREEGREGGRKGRNKGWRKEGRKEFGVCNNVYLHNKKLTEFSPTAWNKIF